MSFGVEREIARRSRFTSVDLFIHPWVEHPQNYLSILERICAKLSASTAGLVLAEISLIVQARSAGCPIYRLFASWDLVITGSMVDKGLPFGVRASSLHDGSSVIPSLYCHTIVPKSSIFLSGDQFRKRSLPSNDHVSMYFPSEL